MSDHETDWRQKKDSRRKRYKKYHDRQKEFVKKTTSPAEFISIKGKRNHMNSKISLIKNIINVLKKAKSEKIFSISFLGKGGGKAKKMSSKCIIISSTNTALIQEEHMFIAHYILNSVEKKLLSKI